MAPIAMAIGPENPVAARGGAITAWLAALVLAAVVDLTGFGYRAANEWQSNAAQLIERRQQQVAVSLTINMARPMRTAQIAVIDRHEWRNQDLDSPQQFARVRTVRVSRGVLRIAPSSGREFRGAHVAPSVVGGWWR